LGGITTVESDPKNFGGKSTATVDLLMFLFFNTTTKYKNAIDFFNKFRNVDDVKVKGYLTIDQEDYIIERKITRKKTKSGDYNTRTDLEFYKIDASNNPINLSGEQRRETEKIITSAIGTEEDFLSTILTTGHNLEELIDSKPTARGQILSRFLGLENLKTKEEKCKEIYNEWCKKLVSNTYNIVQLQSDNETYENEINESELAVLKLLSNLKNFEDELNKLSNKRDLLMTSKNNDIDQELIRTNPTLLKKEIDEIKQKQSTIRSQAEIVIVKEPSEYYNEDDHFTLKSQIDEYVTKNAIIKNDITRNEKFIKELESSSVCPTCKRPLDGVNHKNQIDEIKNTNLSLNKKEKSNDEILTGLRESEVIFINLKKEYDEYERNKLKKAKYELEIEQIQMDIDKNQIRLNNYDNNKKKLEENQKIDNELIVLKTKIDTANADIRATTISIEKNKNNIVNLKEKIKVNLELIKKIRQEEEIISTFKSYLTIFGKNGISKIIMKNTIPVINQELHRILIDSCYFTLELNINDKNELEFLMIDNETRIVKSLNGGSGYEKTIASLALRSILTRVSSLPKPNVVVMDEVFGRIADENLELVGEFFKKIKNYFEHIFVISHNPLIRNWSDNLIMIKKEDNVSLIEYVTSKI
jgi:DNA repair exonuclease SbcCD ATPase subunit